MIIICNFCNEGVEGVNIGDILLVVVEGVVLGGDDVGVGLFLLFWVRGGGVLV